MQQHNTSHTSSTPRPWLANESLNPSGGRERSPVHKQAERGAESFLGLPEGIKRFEILAVLRRVGLEDGWTRGLISHYELLLTYTRESDWAPGGRPVVWLSVEKAAQQLGISPRQVRRNERRMMELGALAFRDSPNHRRFGRRDGEGRIVEAYGLDLSPAAALLPRLARLEQTLVRNRAEWRRLKREIGTARKGIRAAIEWALEHQRVSDEIAETLWQGLQGFAERIRAETPLDGLRQRLAELRAFDARLWRLIGEDRPVDPPGDNSPNDDNDLPANMSATGDRYVRPGGHPCPPPLDDNTNLVPDQGIPVSGGEAAAGPARDEGGAAVAAHRHPPGRGGEEGGRHGDVPRPRVSWDNLLAILPPGLRHRLPLDEHPSWSSLIDAAGEHAAELGISPHAWGEACRAMGREGAAMAVIVVAAKHHRGEVRRPGGYLRALTARAGTGELHLARSVYGLLNTTTGKEQNR